jgi:signal transduction histidine kinase/ligand-binding sensor domain-containing protein/DNA-binding response OmpR family regulator
MMKRLLMLLLATAGMWNGRILSKDIRHYDSKQLTCDLITSICQDAEGFIWVGTEYGLNKFNGVQFAHYYNDPNDSTSLSSNFIRTLLVDRNGTLWIGGSNGLQYYLPDENTFRQITFENNSVPYITGIAEFNSGEIWVVTSGFGTYRMDMKQKKALMVRHIPELDHYSFYNYVYEDSRGLQWFGISNTGLLQYNPDTRKSKLYPREELSGGSVISGMAEDKQGNLLVSTSTTVFRYDRETGNFRKIDSDESWIPARTILITRNGTIYLATYGRGMKRIGKNLDYIIREDVETPYVNMTTAKIQTIYEDKDQNLWLGCVHKGLLMIPNKVTPFNFWNVPDQQYPDAGIVCNVLKDRNGNLWCSVENAGVFKINGHGNIVEHMLADKTISSIYQDRMGNLWFGSKYSGGVYRLDMKTGKMMNDNILNTARWEYKRIAEDNNGNLYISVFGSGFVRYNPATRMLETFRNTPDKANGLSNDWIYDILIDSKGLVWLGHYNGLDCYNPRTGRFTPYMLPNLSKFVTYSLMEDEAGNIWAGTNHGLVYFHRHSKTVEIRSEKDGLSNNLVYGLAKDVHGNIWCSTLKGINLLRVSDKQIISYDMGHGLAGNEYTINAVSFRDDEDMIYFGGVKGITSFHPDSIRFTDTAGHIVLSAMYLNGKSVNTKTRSGDAPVISVELYKAEEIRLSYEDNTFTLEFSTLNFDDPVNTFYEYRLKGLEDKWSVTQPGMNQITYNQLPPGRFIVEARACQSGQYTSVREIGIHIVPPWWRSAGAYVGYVVLLLLGVLQIYLSMKRKHQREINDEKIKLFVNLSHEIRSPMTLIMSPLDSMLRKAYDEDTLRMLRLMKKNADRIMNLMNQLLDIRKMEKGKMSIHCQEVDMVAYIKELMCLFDYQANKRGIRLCFDCLADKLPAWIDPNNFDKVLVNLITNALRYTPDNGIIKILAQEGVNEKFIGDLNHYIEIQILDTGSGIDANKLEKIFERFYTTPSEGTMGSIGFGIGLNLCRLIVKLHHGIITACNREDTEGSCFTIRIPYGNMHLKKSELMESPAPVSYAAPLETEIADNEDTGDRKAKRRYWKTDKIVIADDDEEILHYLSAELSNHYNIIVCGNGKEALQTILSEKPRLVISDVVMPGMDGYALIKQIKKNANINHIPVILLTSRTESEDRVKGIKYGADAYLNKPFGIDELKAVIANLLEKNLRLKGKFSGADTQEDKIEPIEVKLNDERLMERIMKVVNDQLSNPELNVSLLAKEVGASRVQLHRKLKEMTGVPTATFIRNIRMKQAAVLLKDAKQDVSQVSYAVGFPNQSNFSTAFKKHFGVPPSEYASFVDHRQNPVV